MKITIKYVFTICLLLFCLPALIHAETAEEKGFALAQKAEKLDQGFGDSSANLRMILISRHGDETLRKMRGKFLEVQDDGDKSLLIFENPKDVKGTAMLTHSHKETADEQWLYLPALHRVKRISSTGKAGPFMGSEFSYEDLSSPELEKFSYKWLREEKYNGMNCDVIERVPLDKDSGYIREEVWLDKKESRYWKAVYYDRKKTLLKTLISSDYKKYNKKHWRAGKLHMTNHQNGKQTILFWEDYAFHLGLTDKDFHKNVLKRIR
jgi:hypothetical protein